MVYSKISSSVNYKETTELNKEDVKLQANLYELSIHDLSCIVAFGNIRNEFENDGILYFPIYLVKTNNKVMQIGVYEIEKSQIAKYLDENNEFDLNKLIEQLDEPLLYSFATKEKVEKVRKLITESDEETEEDTQNKKRQEKEYASPKYTESDYENSDEEVDSADLEEEEEEFMKYEQINASYQLPPERADIFVLLRGVPIPQPLKEETKKDAKLLRDIYKDMTGNNWMQKFMKNKHYSIVENEGGGDCFFAVIRDAFASIGQKTTVKAIRDKLSKEANEDTFNGYKEQYDMYFNFLKETDTQIKEIKERVLKLQTQVKQTINGEEKRNIYAEAKEAKKQHDELQNDKRVTVRNLTEVKFMKGIDTLEKFKEVIKRCSFWADTWAISTLERVMNIKLILFSKEYYDAKDMYNVLQCGHLIDNILEEKGVFQPEFYIMAEYTGDHYKLIGYKKKQIFAFDEIPYDVKKLVVDRCMERNAGPYALIPEFIEFKEEERPSIQWSDESDIRSNIAETVNMVAGNKQALYDGDVTFVFYSKSSDKPLPGKASGEKIAKGKEKEYSGLASIPQWRKKLSNMWTAPFHLHNKQWATVEHYYQASKFKNENPDIYESFSLDSGSELSNNAELAKKIGNGKMKKFDKYIVKKVEGDKDKRPVNDDISNEYQYEIDKDFEQRSKKEMEDAIWAKFSQNKDMGDLLLQTKKAKLLHYSKGKPAKANHSLMEAREKMK
jgi:predicted NAD-dependent protein-ADP-ribosyltransferase YbiA (DUF1768 family)